MNKAYYAIIHSSPDKPEHTLCFGHGYKRQNFFNRMNKEQNGSVIVVVAICMALFIGIMAFVLDFGSEYVQISRLQNALDCAALAAARELPAESLSSPDWDDAKNTAVHYAGLNGIENAGKITITPVYKDNTTDKRIIGITVSMDDTVKYKFAGIFGIQSGNVKRSATAMLKTVSGMSGLIPLCVTSDTLHNLAVGSLSTIKYGTCLTDINSGWFGIVQLDGSGASIYRDDFVNGCERTVNAGEILDIQTGNLSGPTIQAFSDRIIGHTSCTYLHHEADCPRISTVPVVSIVEDKGVEVVGFARFFIVSVNGNGTDSSVTAIYMGDSVLPDAVTAGNAGDFGLYVVKLTD